MGNCMGRGSSNMDDCGSSSSRHRRQGSRVMDESGSSGCGGGGEEVEKQRLIGVDHEYHETGSSSNKSTREVKIKITKKELEELIGRAELQGLSVEQVLASLINGGDYHHQRSWRPALQSIPEVN